MYVATTGSDGNDGRSIDRPLRTLQRAANLAGPGDVVWVRGGTYAADVIFSRSGTSSQRIVFESYPGECAVLDGAGVPSDRRVGIIDASFVTIRNFVVRNAAGEGLYLANASDNVIANVRSHDNFYSGFTIRNGDRNLLTYVIAHDNYDVGAGGDADGISISAGSGNRIQNCMSYGNSDDGIDTWRSTNTVIEYCAAFRNGFQGSGDGNGFKAGSSGYTVNTVVRHSVAFENRVNGFDFNQGNGVTFDQNTAYGNGAYGFAAGNGATVRNNLAIGNGTPMWMGEVNQQRNSWNLGITSSPFVSTNPASVDFLRLRDGSAAVDAGIDLGRPGDGTPPDLGALPLGQTLSSLLGIRPDELTD
jgi:parallel beta-helix repeat protein